MNLTIPTVGNWYRERQQGITFEVVAMDRAEQTIETQLIDGELGEYDMEIWRQLFLEEVEQPENWSNAFEMNTEDDVDTDAPIRPESWSSPLTLIETDIVNGVLDDLD
ncbi:MAG: hypothetical protein ACI9WS_002489 [Paraglaciecola psychrophila]|jgi:hypothetical protein